MTKSRKIWLDVVRATAILCVVLCHSVEAFYHPVLLGQLQVSFPLWNIENLLFTIGRIGVPTIPYYGNMDFFQLHFLLCD